MVARYEQVARSLMRRIDDGSFPVGAQLPNELDLAEEYAVSRSTVRVALSSLERLGMVSRRRRVGTRVEARRPQTGFARTVSSTSDLVEYSTETTRRVLDVSDVVADDELAELLSCRPGERWTLVRMVRLDQTAASRPVCYTDVYLTPEVAHALGDRIRRPDGLINEMIEQRTGRVTDRVEQRIRARTTPALIAHLLHAEPGVPALEIVRRYVEASRAVSQVTVSLHPADRFEFAMTMTRSGVDS